MFSLKDASHEESLWIAILSVCEQDVQLLKTNLYLDIQTSRWFKISHVWELHNSPPLPRPPVLHVLLGDRCVCVCVIF